MLGLQYLGKCLKLSKQSVTTCEFIVQEHYISFSCLIKTTSSYDWIIFICPFSAKFSYTDVHVCAHTPAHTDVYSPSEAENQFSRPATAFPHLPIIYFLSPNSESLV